MDSTIENIANPKIDPLKRPCGQCAHKDEELNYDPCKSCFGTMGKPNFKAVESKLSPTEYAQLHIETPASALNVQEGGNHYKDLKIQPVEFIHANNIPFLEGNVIKYIARWRNKNGIADLKKAKHYIDLLIELESK
jgi:hypothetical protein